MNDLHTVNTNNTRIHKLGDRLRALIEELDARQARLGEFDYDPYIECLVEAIDSVKEEISDLKWANDDILVDRAQNRQLLREAID